MHKAMVFLDGFEFNTDFWTVCTIGCKINRTVDATKLEYATAVAVILMADVPTLI